MMTDYRQGDIVFVSLEPVRGREMNKTRPCVIVSNANYQKVFNTIMIVPVSSSPKYASERYQESMFFVDLATDGPISGTALLQHLRVIDPRVRVSGGAVDRLSSAQLAEMLDTLKQLF